MARSNRDRNAEMASVEGGGMTNWNNSSIIDDAKNGASITEIAIDHDAKYEQVREALRRRGVKATPHTQRSVRRIAEGMKPLDAVEYLLGVVEQLQGSIAGNSSDILEICPNITAQESRLLGALVSVSGKVLTKKQLYDAVVFDRVDADELPVLQVVDVLLCRIRRKLPASVGSIETVWGHGVRFVSVTS